MRGRARLASIVDPAGPHAPRASATAWDGRDRQRKAGKKGKDRGTGSGTPDSSPSSPLSFVYPFRTAPPPIPKFTLLERVPWLQAVIEGVHPTGALAAGEFEPPKRQRRQTGGDWSVGSGSETASVRSVFGAFGALAVQIFRPPRFPRHPPRPNAIQLARPPVAERRLRG